MTAAGTRPAIGGIVYLILAVMLGGYFAFAAVQGDYGVLRQVQIRAEAQALRAERDLLYAELSRMTNLTTRLSDRFLDTDLLDEQVRDVLGYIRADEIVIR
ncbi:MAG: septum formation initiator family protein [Rhodobacteraceae bacterium]|nr:septum formation initiator family protein [Paracoccaceae bacterium]